MMRPPATETLPKLVDLARWAHALDLAPLETASLEEVDARATTPTRERLESMLTALGALDPEELPSDHRKAMHNLLGMAIWELQQQRGQLVQREAWVDAGVAVVRCCVARRRLIAAGLAVERVWSEASGHVSRGAELRAEVQTRTAQIRSEYTRFLGSLQAASKQADVVTALRRAATGAAQILGADNAGDLSMRDRLELRRVHRRVLDWMRSGVDEKAGRLLLADVHAFCCLLLETHHEPDIVVHELHELRRLAVSLEPCESNDGDHAARAA